MSLSGDLEAFHLSSLLQLLSNDEKTGVLHVTDGANEAKIFIKNGIIIYASSPEERLRLGRLLLNSGELSEEHLHSCLRLAKDGGKKLGRILVAQGHISLETLKKTLHHQVKEILCSLFLWKAGQFTFNDMPISVEGKLVTKMNTMEVLLEASRRIDEWSAIRKQIDSEAQVFKICKKAQNKKEIKLNKAEWTILSLVDGVRNVRKIVDKSRYDEFSAFKGLCSLYLSGLIEKAEGPPATRGQPVDYATITNIYVSLLQVVLRNMQAEVGNRVFAIFEACKAELLDEQRFILQDFDITKQPRANVNAIVQGMKTFKDLKKGTVFLVHSLNTLLELTLEKHTQTLGRHLTQMTLAEIHQTLALVAGYQKDSTEMKGIVHKLENILAHAVPAEEKPNGRSGRFFSLFQKKKPSGRA